MILIALAALFIGICSGFVLARRVLLRTLVGLILGLIALIIIVARTPTDSLPGEGFAILIAAFLIAPPMASGLFGGAVIAWLVRDRTPRA